MKIKVNSTVMLTSEDWNKAVFNLQIKKVSFNRAILIDYLMKLDHEYYNAYQAKNDENRSLNERLNDRDKKIIYRDTLDFLKKRKIKPDRLLKVTFDCKGINKSIKQACSNGDNNFYLSSLIGMQKYIRDFNNRNSAMTVTEYVMGYEDNIPFLMARIVPKELKIISTNVDDEHSLLCNSFNLQYRINDFDKGMLFFIEQETTSLFENMNLQFNKSFLMNGINNMFIPTT